MGWVFGCWVSKRLVAVKNRCHSSKMTDLSMKLQMPLFELLANFVVSVEMIPMISFST